MTCLFHQNMRTFGGGSAGRNATFTASFAAMAATVGNDVVAAGFTEVLNPGGPLQAQLLALSGVINPGLTELLVVDVGVSAMNRGEYVGISWDPTHFTVQHAGQVTYDDLNRRWVANVSDAPFASRVLPLPSDTGLGAADMRTPAFVAGALTGHGNVVVLFMHNMYATGDRTTNYSTLPRSVAAICDAIGYGGRPVYLGGDFNVNPRSIGSRVANPLEARAAELAGVPIFTTLHHCYDFWLVSNPPGAPPVGNAAVFPQSRVANGSDHAAIRLRL